MTKVTMKIHFILYVADQRRSTEFYAFVLGTPPTLDVPGMTEFQLAETTILGLMPEDGIVRLLGEKITHPSLSRQAPRGEIYLVVEDAAAFHARALLAGARELSPLEMRDWNHSVAYSVEPDDYILAFASR